jgi:hypothetical protein
MRWGHSQIAAPAPETATAHGSRRLVLCESSTTWSRAPEPGPTLAAELAALGLGLSVGARFEEPLSGRKRELRLPS